MENYLYYVGPKDINYFSFVSEGWKKEKSNKSLCNQVVEAKKIELTPQKVKFHSLNIPNFKDYLISICWFIYRPIRIIHYTLTMRSMN